MQANDATRGVEDTPPWLKWAATRSSLSRARVADIHALVVPCVSTMRTSAALRLLVVGFAVAACSADALGQKTGWAQNSLRAVDRQHEGFVQMLERRRLLAAPTYPQTKLSAGQAPKDEFGSSVAMSGRATSCSRACPVPKKDVREGKSNCCWVDRVDVDWQTVAGSLVHLLPFGERNAATTMPPYDFNGKLRGARTSMRLCEHPSLHTYEDVSGRLSQGSPGRFQRVVGS